MAIDDNEDYTLTGAQVKDLVARIKAGGGGGMTVYVDASFATPSSITGVFSDSALTTPADPDAMAGIISAGSTVIVVYDGGQSEEVIELASVNSNSRSPEVGQAFTSIISTNAIFSAPTMVTLLYDGTLDSWSVETAPVPTKTSDITNDGSDGTSTYVEADDLATVATSGSYNDLTDLPSDRLYRMLVPTGTEITSNKNLNTVEFLVVGRYYCSTNATVATLSNCPTSSAFMMEVFSPLSTTIDDETTRAWCYRTRILTTFTGEMYVQTCSTNATPNNWSYGSWRRFDVPGVKNATAATHTDWNNNQDYLPNMRFLSLWNGAYNSSGNSNLSYLASNAVKTANINDSAVTTAKINNSAVTTDKINNSAVTKAKMAHIPSPDPSSVITNWGSISASGNNEKTMSADGFVVGKGCTFGGDQSAIVKLNGQEVGGVAYTTFTGYIQVSYCIPVKSGDKVQFYLNKSGPQHQGCKLIGWKM